MGVIKINPEIARRFTYGQIETRRADRPYVLRGDIEIIVVHAGILDVTCFWVAERSLGDQGEDGWKLCNITSFQYQVNQYDYDDDDLFRTKCAQLTHSGHPYEDQITLYLPDGDRLDPIQVEGLEIPEPTFP